MRKRILYSLVILTILVIAFIGTKAIADTITLNNTEYNLNNGGNYITKFVKNMSKSDFLNIKWEDIQNNYYTADGDKGSTASTTRRIVCVNQNSGDGQRFKMKPVAVIDIEGGRIKAEGTMVVNGKTDWMYLGDKAAAMARAAEYEGSHTNAYVEAFLNYDNNQYRWKDFFDTLKERGIFTTEKQYTDAFSTVHRYYPVNDTYRKVLFPGGNVTGYYNIYPEIDSEKSKNISLTYDNEKNITEIGNYVFKDDQAIHLNDKNITTQLSIKLEGVEAPIIGQLIKVSEKTYKIEIPGKIDRNITSIKFKQSYKGYKAKIIVMYTNFSQNRLIMDGESTTIEYEFDFEKPQTGTDVSLQKYIIGTIEGDGTAHVQDTNNNGNSLISGTNGYHEVVTTEEKEVETEEYNEFDNYLMIGDSRTVSMYYALGGTSQSDVINDTITSEEKSITFLGKIGVQWNYWLGGDNKQDKNADSNIDDDKDNYNNTLIEKLKSAKDSNKKTKCILWLGVNGLNQNLATSKSSATEYFNKLKDLTMKYPNIEFVCYGVGYVNENKYTYQNNYNQRIDAFNTRLKEEIDSYNDKYKNKFEKCDFNDDNKIDNDDVNLLMKYVRGQIENDKISEYGDLNNDGKITTADCGMLSQYAKGYIRSNLYFEDFNNKLIIYGKDQNGTDIIQLRNIGNIIKNDNTVTDNEGLHYVSGLNISLWDQIFLEGTGKARVEKITDKKTTLVPNTDNNNTNNENNYNPTGRENRYAVSQNNSILDGLDGSYNHKDKEISNHTNRKVVVSDFCKSDKPVEIEAGDSVVYKIEVYNNRNSESEVTVSDDFSTLGGPIITEIRTSTSEQFNEAKAINTDNNVEYSTDGAKNNFKFKLAGGETRYFYVTIKYQQYTTEILRNRAWISSSNTENNTNYRTIDADYIKMKDYKVSLEKYIYDRTLLNYDFNEDGVIDIGDSNLIQAYLADDNGIISPAQWKKIENYADINKDGIIDVVDAIELQIYFGTRLYRDGKAEYLTFKNNELYVDETDKDTKLTRHNTFKFDNVVTVSQGDNVTYRIKVSNDGETKVFIPSITDILPENAVDYSNFKLLSATKYNRFGNAYENKVTARLEDSNENRKVIIIDTSDINNMLNPKDYIIFEVSVPVTASNMSLDTYKNTALITNNEIINKNNITIIDKTPFNNEDSDYIKLNYPNNSGILSGIVWNDTNRLKDNKEEGYNSLYDNVESKLSGIKVYLYRTGLDGRNSPIANATTDSEGKYSFADKDIYTSIPSRERHIKGPTVSDTVNRWNEKYYSYYIVFEYDGIKYTSTPDGQSSVNITDQAAFENGTYQINSNAKESDSKVKESRENFNSRFTKINKDSDIEYDRYIGKTSIEGQEYNIIPQSIHKYNESKMSMQSATNVITLANNDVLLQEIKYINLGLRGRDTLDLSVKTDIDKISVQVNGVTTDYAGKNSVTVRKSDLSVGEDTANFKDSVIAEGTTEETQDIRQTDLVKARDSNYSNDQLLQAINVTYKITVSNESKTGVSEVSIIDYYDSRYDFKEVKVENCILDKVDDGSSSSEYNSKIITTKGNGTIYVTYELKSSAISKLKGLNIDEKLPTYNMAEIYEYTSAGENEYTRGLIDIDSAPGSVASEKVILSDDYNGLKAGEKAIINEAAIASRPTTLQYYFNKTDLQKINYEDDTGVKAVIFRVADDPRTIVGKVFRDNTTVNSDKIKTGNGKFDDGEDIVAGATVQLVEYNSNKSPEEIAENEGKVIFSTTTNKDGEYTFYGYIPGNYIIRYSYGNSDYTVLKNKFSSTLNKYSYNGEDYQATNNTGSYGSEKLEHNSNFWYISNEQNGVSTATDNKERRRTVSTNATNSDSLMTLLNDARDGKDLSNENVTTIKNDTYMYASTYMMRLTGEKADENGNVPNVYGNNYRISNMNFGIAEVPVSTITLKNNITKLTVIDAAGDNKIVEAIKGQDGKWTTKGNIKVTPEKLVSEIEEQKLQGAKLQITYTIESVIDEQINYDNSSTGKPVVKGIINFVDNNLSYNSQLEGNNNWKVISLEDVKKKYSGGLGTVAKSDTQYATILEAENITEPMTLTLEKTLSSQDVTLEDIITSSNTNSYEYANIIEISGIDYANSGGDVFKDRVRTDDRHIILAGQQFDYKAAEVASLIPPLGENNNIQYYVIAALSIAILAVGIVFIKKFAIKKD